MQVIIDKVTDKPDILRAFNMTSRSNTGIKIDDWRKPYMWEHSPIRAELFWVELIGIETAVSEEILRHTLGVIGPFIQTGREDRGGKEDARRSTPRNHGGIVGAEWFINIAKKRFCYKAYPKCTAAVEQIKETLQYINHDLAAFMVPQCVYRNFMCQEPRGCGRLLEIAEKYGYYPRMFTRIVDGKIVKGDVE